MRLIVNLTAMGVELDESFMLRLLEKYVEKSGIPYVHLRPNWFMQNFNSGPMLADIRRSGGLHLPASHSKISFIDVRDVAAVASAALTEPRHFRQRLHVDRQTRFRPLRGRQHVVPCSWQDD